MRKPKSRLTGLTLLVGTLGLTWALAGCGSGNPNEREYFEHTPPGVPSDHPGESVAQRKARLRSPTKQELQAEARRKAAEAKAAGTADARKSP
jgi:hypothetical protein